MKYYIEQKIYTYRLYTKKNVYICKKGSTFPLQSNTMIKDLLFLKGIKLEPHKRIEIPEEIFNIIKPKFHCWGNS